MQIKKASRKQTKIKLGIAAPSGFGKTFGALKIANGLVNGDWEKVVLIDTENGSGELYSHLGDYSVLQLTPDYSPEKYIEAINLCIKSGFECIIIDSITHEWSGKGGCLEIHEKLGGRYTDWKSVTPRHNKFIDAIIQAPVHIITTVRSKQDYDHSKDSNGKAKVEKVGLKQETRDGFEYELTISLDIINDKHLCKSSKDRTGLFSGLPEFVINEETGKKILDWCNSASKHTPNEKDLEDIKTNKEKISKLQDQGKTNEEISQLLRSGFNKGNFSEYVLKELVSFIGLELKESKVEVN